MKSTPSRRCAVGVLALALGTTGLVACSSSGGGSAAGGSGVGSGSCKTATGTLHMAFIYATTTQNPFQEMALGAQAAAKADGHVQLTSQAPAGIDGTAEVGMFQAAMQTAKDGIAYDTTTPEPFTNALKNAASQGIPLVAVDAAPPAGAAKAVPLFVGNSNTELGKLLGRAYLKTGASSGQIVLGNDIPSLPLLRQRLDGVKEALEAKIPASHIAGPFDAGSEKSDNYAKWKAIVAAHPKAAAFIGVGANDGESLPLIKQQTGKKFAAGSADISIQSLKNVQNGSLFALSSPEHWMKGYIAMEQLIHAKRTCSKLPTGWWDSGNLLIDKSNVDSILARQKSPAARTKWFQKEIAKQLAHPPIKPMSDVH